MSNRKNQNSIIVLATLGVYLGLVLAGATPQVLAQAAMTRQFDFKDEIEVKDDLDKKPDPEQKEFKGVATIYLNGVARFLAELEKVRSNVGPEEALDSFGTRRVSHVPCSSAETSVFLDWNSATVHKFRVLLDRAKRDAVLNLNSFSDCLPFKSFDEHEARKSGITINYGREEFRYEVLLDFGTYEKAELVLAAIENDFDPFTRKGEENQIQTVLYKHTRLTHVKNQVFIVTQLPRAGLDPLLANNAK